MRVTIRWPDGSLGELRYQMEAFRAVELAAAYALLFGGRVLRVGFDG